MCGRHWGAARGRSPGAGRPDRLDRLKLVAKSKRASFTTAASRTSKPSLSTNSCFGLALTSRERSDLRVPQEPVEREEPPGCRGVLLSAARYSSSTGMPHCAAAPNSAAPIGLSSRWSMPLRLPSTDSFGLLWASTPFRPATPMPSAKGSGGAAPAALYAALAQVACSMVISSPRPARDCWSAAPLLRSNRAQFPDFVDCCSPFADAETRMQSNASAEPVPTSPSASTANNTVRRRFTWFSLSIDPGADPVPGQRVARAILLPPVRESSRERKNPRFGGFDLPENRRRDEPGRRQSGYSSSRQARGSSGCPFGVRSSRNE